MTVNKDLNMKVLLFLILFVYSNILYASQKAITDDGKIVILNNNRTWRYDEGISIERNPIKTNNQNFIKQSNSSFRISAVPTTIGVYIDPSQWTYSKDKEERNKLIFQSKRNADLYAMLISEGIQVNIDRLGDLALDNAKSVAPDSKVVKKEYRNVNGSKILYMEIEGTVQSINFKYAGYYSSNKSGSVQLITYSGARLLDANIALAEQLLNGLVVE